MEEEIIGNRWKELDYDGYCLSHGATRNERDTEVKRRRVHHQ